MKLTKHHVLPRSRGGTQKDIVLWPQKFHSIYHDLFQNLLPEEAIEMIRILSKPGEAFTNHDINQIRDRLRGTK